MKEKDFANILLKLSGKEYSIQDVERILPKLQIVTEILDVSGNEILDIMDLLIDLNNHNLLDCINKESLSFIEFIHNIQLLTGATSLNNFDIMKHVFTPYNLNICNEDDEVYTYQSKFELLITILVGLVSNPITLRAFAFLNKYNKELYDLVLLQKKCMMLLKKNDLEDNIYETTIIHMCGVFYFCQDKYGKDYRLIEDITKDIIERPDSFQAYCDYTGISNKVMFLGELKQVYSGIIKLLDSAYLRKKEEKRENQK